MIRINTALLFSLVVIVCIGTIQAAFASCVQDLDWPEAPCLDEPPYPESYLKETYQKYYEYKGEDWMKAKKLEMDQAIRNGTLIEWVEWQKEPNDFGNSNVYFYYYINGQAPAINEYYSGIIRDESKPILTPWYASSAGWGTLAGIAVAVGTATFYMIRKAKQK